LPDVQHGDVGLLQVDMQAMTIRQQMTFTLPSATRPDATIAAAVELVEEEARRAANR
jgi:hypothetical protein